MMPLGKKIIFIVALLGIFIQIVKVILKPMNRKLKLLEVAGRLFLLLIGLYVLTEPQGNEAAIIIFTGAFSMGVCLYLINDYKLKLPGYTEKEKEDFRVKKHIAIAVFILFISLIIVMGIIFFK